MLSTWPDLLALVVLVAALPVFALLWFVPAPYGRHARPGWGPEIPGRVGWMVMEAPTLLVFLPVLIAGGRSIEVVVLGALWVLHYGHRTLIYPLRQRTVRPMSAVVVGFGVLFQVVNSAGNSGALVAAEYSGWMGDPRFWTGSALFVVGQVVVHHGDNVVRALRGPGDLGYRVPTGGLFRYVTNVSYLGELLTWLGWALATGTLAGLAMFVFSAANLVPRAASNHAWYRREFSGYPRKRRILLPWLW